MASIYALCDPDTAEVRYIGKANDPEKRLLGHIRDAKVRQTPVYAWIRKLTAAGLAPEMVVIRRGCKDWKAEERALIAAGRALGLRLLNVADGGDEPFMTREQRARNGSATLAAIRTGIERKDEAGLPFMDRKRRELARHYEWSARLGRSMGDKAWEMRGVEKLRALG